MKKILTTSLIIIGLCSLVAFFSNPAQAIDLVKDGQSQSQIVISQNASPTEQYVAKDLQRIIQKISGANLLITNRISKSTFNIVIGTPQNFPEIKAAELLQDDNPETVRIETQGKVLFLTGNTPASALRAVYTFLQEPLDCRWFWPGESGEYLPRKSSISINDLDITETPSIRYRTLAINVPHWNEDAMIWMSRNRMNLYVLDRWTMTNERIAEMHEKGLQATMGGHSIILPENILKEHPTYRALYGGKRQGAQLCWGNPDVQDAVAHEIENWWKQYPDMDSIEFLAADTTHYCDDKLCQALAPDVSTRWQKFCQIVMDKVHQNYPDKNYWTLAYQGYGRVPEEAAPSFDFTSYAVLQQDYTKPMTAKTNDKERKIIEEWQKVSGNIALRGYQFIPFPTGLYTPFTPILLQDISWAHKMGLQGWYSELAPYGFPEKYPLEEQRWTANRMALYAVAVALWNAEVDVDALTRDWTEHLFGAAAKPIQNYYERMQDAWENTSEPLRHFANAPASFVDNFISDDLLIKANADFAAAREDAHKINDINRKKQVLQQINLEAAMLNNWRKVLLLQRGLPERFAAKAPKIVITPQMTAAPNDPAWKDILPLPALEDDKFKPATNSTKVLLQWDQNALYLRFINQGNIPDDAIKVLLSDSQNQENYQQIIIDAENKIRVISTGKIRPSEFWSGEISHVTQLQDFSVPLVPRSSRNDTRTVSSETMKSNGWILDVKLPFKEFGIAPENGTIWKMSFQRADAGWPDASQDNPLAFGAVELVDKVIAPKRILFYNADSAPDDALLVTFRKAGFDAQPLTQSDLSKSTFAANADAIVLNGLTPQDTESLDDAMKNVIVPFVKSGGLLLLTGHSDVPLEKWFGADAAIGWSDVVAINAERKSTFVAKGEWTSSPHDLKKIIETVTTPRFGYRPASEAWNALAKVRMSDGKDSVYLMNQKFGEGEIIVTSSSFGYKGGWEMFGDRRIQNVPLLMENLME